MWSVQRGVAKNMKEARKIITEKRRKELTRSFTTKRAWQLHRWEEVYCLLMCKCRRQTNGHVFRGFFTTKENLTKVFKNRRGTPPRGGD